MKKRYYFKYDPKNQMDAKAIADKLMDGKWLFRCYLNNRYTAATLFERFSESCNLQYAIEDIKAEAHKVIIEKVETDEMFRQENDIGYIEE